MKKQVWVAAMAGACTGCMALPGSANAQVGLLDGVGGIVDTTTEQITSTLDQVLGGAQGVLPSDTLGDVLVTLTNPPGASGPPGPDRGAQVVGGGVAATGVQSGTALVDRRAPVATVKVRSRLSQVARTRRLRLEVRADEPGVVAFSSTIRPGLKRRGVRRSLKHRRSVIHVPAVVLAFRRAGALTVELRLSAADAARLGRSRNGRMSVGLLTADVARNQSSERLKRHLRR